MTQTIENMQQRIIELRNHLSDKHLKVADNYLNGEDQATAYVNAGYAAKTAKQRASDLFKKNKLLSEYIELCRNLASQKSCDKFEITEERIKLELARIGFANAKNYFDEEGNFIPIHQLSDDVAAAISEVSSKEIMSEGECTVIERRYKFADMSAKNTALRTLGSCNSLAMFKERIQINGGNPLLFLIKRSEEESIDASPLPSGE